MGWTPWHDRLHRRLLAQPAMLPRGSRLLLALSGGQDSMALLALLRGLQPLHHWQLHLWHGDHGWHAGSSRIAQELQIWCCAEGLDLAVGRAALESPERSEAAARAWRYGALATEAERLSDLYPHNPCRIVISAHTASDRAETLLLQLARGSDLAGLGSQRHSRRLFEGSDLQLIRPLRNFSRADTARICSDLALPIWDDPSNRDPAYARNRIRAEVLPVLEQLHPGCSGRLAELAERMSQLQDTQASLNALVLEHLSVTEGSLDRRRFGSLPLETRRTLLAHWLRVSGVPPLTASQLEELAQATAAGSPAAGRDLSAGWRIHWRAEALQLEQRP